MQCSTAEKARRRGVKVRTQPERAEARPGESRGLAAVLQVLGRRCSRRGAVRGEPHECIDGARRRTRKRTKQDDSFTCDASECAHRLHAQQCKYSPKS